MFGQANSSFHGSGKMYHPNSYGANQDIASNKPIIQQPPQAMKKRFNLVGGVFALFIPWTLFCLVVALWSFDFRYLHPAATVGITLIFVIPLVLMTVYKVIQSFRALVYGRYNLVDTGDKAAWTLFILISCCVALICAFLLGNYNYQMNMRGVYDVTSMNSYVGVNPSTMRGQELMDAGQVQFIDGTNLDFKYANGFKNTDVYCVAPITFKDTVLSAYDFWAVGKNCCSDSSTTDFKSKVRGSWPARCPERRGQPFIIAACGLRPRVFRRLRQAQMQALFSCSEIYCSEGHAIRNARSALGTRARSPPN